MSTRSRYLLVSEVEVLRAWGRDLCRLFDEGPYLVGSALQHKDWRDVDVRIMLDDDRFDALVTIQNPRLLNLALSLWGQKVTGLPIDCQIQRVTDANAEFDGPRDPLHLPADLLDPWTPTFAAGEVVEKLARLAAAPRPTPGIEELLAELHALAAKWKVAAEVDAQHVCADELLAALAAAPPATSPEPDGPILLSVPVAKRTAWEKWHATDDGTVPAPASPQRPPADGPTCACCGSQRETGWAGVCRPCWTYINAMPLPAAALPVRDRAPGLLVSLRDELAERFREADEVLAARPHDEYVDGLFTAYQVALNMVEQRLAAAAADPGAGEPTCPTATCYGCPDPEACESLRPSAGES